MSRISRANGLTRHEILSSIKSHGAMTAEELGRELNISQVAVRQHLASLEAENIVLVSAERRGLGRPSHRYRLTPVGDESFPRRYDALADMLLEELHVMQGEAVVTELLQRIHTRTVDLLQTRLKDRPLSVRLQELARYQSEIGFMAEVIAEPPTCFRLVKHNCAVCAVARNHPEACCAGELPLLKQLLGDVEIVREGSILDGDYACTFHIRDCREQQ
jgi:predicted ArsR family transcriptional regulator